MFLEIHYILYENFIIKNGAQVKKETFHLKLANQKC